METEALSSCYDTRDAAEGQPGHARRFAPTQANQYNITMSFLRRKSSPSSKAVNDPYAPIDGDDADHTLIREMADEDLEFLNLIDGEEVDYVKLSASRPEFSELNDARAETADDGASAVFRNREALPRLMATWRELDASLDRWWTDGAYPSKSVLRDGLLLLEAGYMLEESHCSLILRGALHQERGMLTALKYQTDPQRSALIIREELVNSEHPMPLSLLRKIYDEDEHAALWAPFLRSELLESLRLATAEQRELALDALSLLSGSPVEAPVTADILFEETPAPRWVTWLLLACLFTLAVGLVAGTILWQQERVKAANTVRIPANIYVVSNADGGKIRIRASSYLVDQLEVTNVDYRQCIARGGCPALAAQGSATREEYATSPTYDRFPVVNVTWAGARAYCEYRGKRLPSEEEWRIAASFAPATERTYRYPWGNQFEVSAANTAEGGIGDTQQVGHYTPAGNSPFRAADMAGNVAEWTSSRVAPDSDEVWVKGGSFRDDALQAVASARVARDVAAAANWIGFRCAATPVLASLWE